MYHAEPPADARFPVPYEQSKCGVSPPFPYGDMTATSSDFAWQAYDYAASRYAACNRPYGVAQVFLWIMSCAFFGYAGWRRVQMRRRFGLPGDDVRDYTTWMLCPMCALCQEGRTLLHNRVDNGVWHGPAPLPQQGMGAPPVQAFGGAGGVFEAQRPYATLPPGQYPPAPHGANPWAAPSLLPQQAATGVPPPPPPPPRVAPALAQPAAGMYVPPSATDVDAAAAK
jgi:Cys-rich protein (TIGR01571 family)